jgi:hypothetical protein
VEAQIRIAAEKQHRPIGAGSILKNLFTEKKLFMRG